MEKALPKPISVKAEEVDKSVGVKKLEQSSRSKVNGQGENPIQLPASFNDEIQFSKVTTFFYHY